MFFHNSTKTYIIYFVAEVSLVLFLFLIARSSKWHPSSTLISKLFLLFIAILTITSLIGVDPTYSFWGSFDRMTGLLTWFHFLALFFVMCGILQTQEEWVHFFSVSCVVAFLVAIIHLFSLGGAELVPEARGGSTFGNTSFFAVYLLFHVFFAIFVATRQSKSIYRVLWIGTSILFMLTILNINAVATQISLVGGLMLFGALWLIGQSRLWKQKTGWSILTVLAVTFILTCVLAFQPGSIVHDTLIRISSGSRFAIWGIAWEGIKEHPWVGWGLENFVVVSEMFTNSCLGSQACGGEFWFDRAHNKLLDVWIESGLLGLFIYLTLLATTVLQFWHASKNKRISWTTFSIFTAVLAAYSVQNLTALDTNTSLLFWIVILAFAHSLSQKHSSNSIPYWKPIIALLLLPFTLFFFIFQPILGNLAFSQTLDATTLEKRLETYKRATTLSPLGIDMRRLFLADQTSRVLWSIPTETLRQIESAATIELELAQIGLTQSLSHFAQQLRVRIGLGIMYQTEGHFFDPVAFKNAEIVLQEAISHYPLVPQPKWTLAGVYLDMGRPDLGLNLTQEVLNRYPYSPQAYNYQLIVLRWLGDSVAFEALAQKAITQIPNIASDIEKLRILDFSKQSQSILMLFHR